MFELDVLVFPVGNGARELYAFRPSDRKLGTLRGRLSSVGVWLIVHGLALMQLDGDDLRVLQFNLQSIVVRLL